jgi:hypothetical protein
MALASKRMSIPTPDQVKQWVLADLAKPGAAAELKSRSDEADAVFRAKGLLNSK